MYRFRDKYETSPGEVESGDAFAVKIVAVAHPDGVTWAAYIGPSDWSDQNVADGGIPIKQVEAERLFPVLANTSRRYEPQP